MYKCPFCGEVFLREHDFSMHVISCPKQNTEPNDGVVPEEANDNVEIKKEVKIPNKAGRKGKK